MKKIFFFIIIIFFTNTVIADTDIDVSDDLDFQVLKNLKQEAHLSYNSIPKSVKKSIFKNSSTSNNFQIYGTNIYSNVSFQFYGELYSIKKARGDAYINVAFCKKGTACSLNDHLLFIQYYKVNDWSFSHGLIKIFDLEFINCEEVLDGYEKYCNENLTKVNDRTGNIELQLNYEDFSLTLGHGSSADATEVFINVHSLKNLLDFNTDYWNLRHWHLRNPLLNDKLVSLNTLAMLKKIKVKKPEKNNVDTKSLLKKLLGNKN
tara:strand:+ start:7 stop:792 length:786 start_codon:yes stop_codon:yes gene_type:complete